MEEVRDQGYFWEEEVRDQGYFWEEEVRDQGYFWEEEVRDQGDEERKEFGNRDMRGGRSSGTGI